MAIREWPAPGTPDMQRFGQARRQLHSLVQWLARMERSYGSAESAGSGITLRWSDTRKAIITSQLGQGLRLELRLPEMVLQFLEDDEAANHPLHTEEHSPAHVEAWLLIELLHRGIERKKFSKALPYDVSGLMSGDSEEFSPEAYQQELEALTDWLARAAEELGLATGNPVGEEDGGIVLRPEDLSLEAASSSNRILGFKASGAKLGEPFFYVRTTGDGVQPGRQTEVILPASQLPSSGGSDRLRTLFQAAQ